MASAGNPKQMATPIVEPTSPRTSSILGTAQATHNETATIEAVRRRTRRAAPATAGAALELPLGGVPP